MQKTGLLIAIDGKDTIQVTNQAKLLTERLLSSGYKAKHISAVNRTASGSSFVNKYEAGKYPTEIIYKPYTPAVFYALEHFENLLDIKTAINNDYIVVCDQYIISNLLKNLANPNELSDLLNWLQNLEFGMLGLPKPNETFVLEDLSTEVFTSLKNQYSGDKIHSLNSKVKKLTELHTEIWQTLEPIFVKKYKQIQSSSLKSEQKTNDNEVEVSTSLSSLALIYLKTFASKKYYLYLNSTYKDSDIIFDYSKNSKTKELIKSRDVNIDKIHTILKQKYKQHVTKNLLQGLMPLSKLNSVELKIDKNNLYGFIQELLECTLPELNKLGLDLIRKYKMNINQTNLNISNTAKLKGDTSNSVKLVRFSPRNELEVCTDLMFKNSSDSFTEIHLLNDGKSYTEKLKTLKNSNTNLFMFNYCFEVISSLKQLNLLGNQNYTRLLLQSTTPLNGYVFPTAFESEDTLDLYEQLFNTNIKIHQNLISSNELELSQYTVLNNSKCRYLIYLNAEELKQIASSAVNNPALLKYYKKLVKQIKDIHPTIYQKIKR